MSEIEKKDNGQYILQSVDNALQLIEILCETEEIGVTQIAKELGIGKSTAFRLLATLENWGYIRKNEESSRYRLGMKFAHVGTIVLNRQEIVRYSRPFLEDLSKAFNETAHLVILEDDFNVRFVDKVKGNALMHMESFVGAKKPSYCTATGKALLASEPVEKVLQYLRKQGIEKLTEHTITSEEALLSELEEVRQQGYAVDAEESEIGLTCYAAPIYNNSGKAIAAISLSGPTTRMKINSKEITETIKDIAKRISKSLK